MKNERCELMEKEMWKNALNNIDEKYIKEAEKLMDEPVSVDELSILRPEKEEKKKGTGNLLFAISAMAAALICVIGVGVVFGDKGEDIRVSSAATSDGITEEESAAEITTTAHTIIEETVPDEAEIITSVSEGASPLVPELVFIDEFEDTKIKDYAFLNNKKLESYTVPDGITVIGKGAFADCTHLKTVYLSESVKIIEESAFKNCNALVEITMPSDIQYIGERAFENCISLTSVTIPDGIDEISASLFKGCKSLEEISLPESITTIKDEAFYGCESLKRAELSDNLNEIASAAFYNCRSLEEIILPESLKLMGLSLFGNCESLKEITIPSQMKYINNETFINCSSLSSVTIGENVTDIGAGAFENCVSLERISDGEGFFIPYGLENIGDYAFKGCEKLWCVLPDSVKTIGEGAFEGCTMHDGTFKSAEIKADTTGDMNYTGTDIGEMFLLECYPCDKFYSVTSYFGYNEFFEKGHDGIDISWEGCHGANVYAAKSGVVKEAVTEYAEEMGYGKYVVISHDDGYETVYYHCNDIYVEVGDEVQSGDVIAAIGTTGWSTGPHLHFGLLRGGESVNPLEYYADQRKVIVNSVKSIYKGDNSFKLSAPVAYPDAITEPYYEDGGYEGHTGIDYAWDNCLGADIFAAGDGTVVYSDWLTDYGLCVIIDHGNGIGTIYAHCSEISVEKGDTVSVGDTIAKIGTTGKLTGAYLHFEVIINGFSQNPLRYIK